MCAAVYQNNAAEVEGWNDKRLMAVIDVKVMDDLLMSTVEYKVMILDLHGSPSEL